MCLSSPKRSPHFSMKLLTRRKHNVLAEKFAENYFDDSIRAPSTGAGWSEEVYSGVLIEIQCKHGILVGSSTTRGLQEKV